MMYHCHEMHFLSFFASQQWCKFLKPFAIKGPFLWQNIFNYKTSSTHWENKTEIGKGRRSGVLQLKKTQFSAATYFLGFLAEEELVKKQQQQRSSVPLTFRRAPSFGSSTRHYSSATGWWGNFKELLCLLESQEILFFISLWFKLIACQCCSKGGPSVFSSPSILRAFFARLEKAFDLHSWGG